MLRRRRLFSDIDMIPAKKKLITAIPGSKVQKPPSRVATLASNAVPMIILAPRTPTLADEAAPLVLASSSFTSEVSKFYSDGRAGIGLATFNWPLGRLACAVMLPGE